jgi:hypothetical protein
MQAPLDPPPTTPDSDASSPQARRARIASLYAMGHSYRAIARMLDLPLTTVWRTVQRLAAEQSPSPDDPRALQLTRAIAVQHQITSNAWQILHAEEQLEAAARAGHLTYTRQRIIRPAAPPGDSGDSGDPAAQAPAVIIQETRRPTFRSRRPQLLRLILAAEREIARLENLYSFAARRDASAPHRASDR